MGAFRIVFTTSLVVIEVNRPLICVVEVVHVAVVVDPKPCITAGTTARQCIHAIRCRREGPPLDVLSCRHLHRVVSQREVDGLIARPTRGTVDGVALSVTVVATALDELITVQPDLIVGVSHEAIPVGVVHGEHHAVFPIGGVDAKGEQGIVRIGHIGLEQQVPCPIGQFPAHFIGPCIRLDHHGKRILPILAGVLRKREHRDESEQQAQGAGSIQHVVNLRQQRACWKQGCLSPIQCLTAKAGCLFLTPWDTTTTTTTIPKPNKTKSEDRSSWRFSSSPSSSR